MAAQTKILSAVPENAGSVGGSALQGEVGILAIGKPGDITSPAFGPIVKTGSVATDGGEKFGDYVSGKGIVVNSNDVANMANYDENFLASKGQTVGYLTYGTCVAWTSALTALANASTGMNYKVLACESKVTKDAGANITAITPNWSTFAAKVANAEGSYVFKATVASSTTTWKIDGTTVSLADYGITVTGTVANNDQFTVKFYALCDLEVTGFKA